MNKVKSYTIMALREGINIVGRQLKLHRECKSLKYHDLVHLISCEYIHGTDYPS